MIPICSDPHCTDELCDVIVTSPTPIRYRLDDSDAYQAVANEARDRNLDLDTYELMKLSLAYTDALAADRKARAERQSSTILAEAQAAIKAAVDSGDYVDLLAHRGLARQVREFTYEQLRSGVSMIDVPQLATEQFGVKIDLLTVMRSVTNGNPSMFWTKDELWWLRVEGLLYGGPIYGHTRSSLMRSIGIGTPRRRDMLGVLEEMYGRKFQIINLNDLIDKHAHLGRPALIREAVVADGWPAAKNLTRVIAKRMDRRRAAEGMAA